VRWCSIESKPTRTTRPFRRPTSRNPACGAAGCGVCACARGASFGTTTARSGMNALSFSGAFVLTLASSPSQVASPPPQRAYAYPIRRRVLFNAKTALPIPFELHRPLLTRPSLSRPAFFDESVSMTTIVHQHFAPRSHAICKGLPPLDFLCAFLRRLAARKYDCAGGILLRELYRLAVVQRGPTCAMHDDEVTGLLDLHPLLRVPVTPI